MTNHLVNVERRYFMQPGAIADKALRDSLGEGWLVVVLEAGTNQPIVLRVSNIYGDLHYAGTAVNLKSMPLVRFESSNVFQIISTSEKKDGKGQRQAAAEEDLHHAVRPAQVPSLKEVWASLDDPVSGRAARGHQRASRPKA